MHDLLNLPASFALLAASIRRGAGLREAEERHRGRTGSKRPGKNRDKVKAARKQRRTQR